MRNANEYMPQSNEGWYMLETGKDEGINNIILYIDDIYDNPTISSAIFINLNNETDIDDVRRDLYEYEQKRSITARRIVENYEKIGLIRREYSSGIGNIGRT